MDSLIMKNLTQELLEEYCVVFMTLNWVYQWLLITGVTLWKCVYIDHQNVYTQLFLDKFCYSKYTINLSKSKF